MLGWLWTAHCIIGTLILSVLLLKNDYSYLQDHALLTGDRYLNLFNRWSIDYTNPKEIWKVLVLTVLDLYLTVLILWPLFLYNIYKYSRNK